MKHKGQVIALMVLAVGLLLTWLAYAPGLGGSLHFDDHHNLSGLSQVEDTASAIRFLSSGSAGPLGRPLALISFAPQAYAWPSGPETFLKTNIQLHLLNGLLVCWVLVLLSRARGVPTGRAALIAATSALLWMLLPLLASSSLLIVQRMTTLSGTMVLAGLVGYLYAREQSGKWPRLSLIMMAAALFFGGTLGVLTKETGALLVVYVLVIEATLLRRPDNVGQKAWGIFFYLLLVAPTALLVTYLIGHAGYSEGTIARRGFSGAERMLTQGVILWEYPLRALFPYVPALGPFHDDYQVVANFFSPKPFTAAIAWVITISGAIWFRRRVPLIAFVVFWYLGGHLIESTIVPLELYFEHRNYLPLVGPMYAMSFAAISLAVLRPRMVAACVGGYALVLAGVLFSHTSMWGKPWLAAEMWHIYRPDSVRATQYLAHQYSRLGDLATAHRVLEDFADTTERGEVVKIQIVYLSCLIRSGRDHRLDVDYLINVLSRQRFSHGVDEAVARFYDLVQGENGCLGVDEESVYLMARALADNPIYEGYPGVLSNLHQIMARVSIDQRDLDLTMRHLQAAFDASPRMNILYWMIGSLVSAGLYDEAKYILYLAEQRRPLNPLRAHVWKSGMDNLHDVVDQAVGR